MKFVTRFIVVSQQVLSSGSMAEERKNISVSDRPEIWTGPIIPDTAKHIIFNKWMQVLPGFQVARTKKKVRPYRLTAWSDISSAPCDGIIHAILFPYKGIAHSIRHLIS